MLKMTTEHIRSHRDQAIKFREDGQYVQAGEYYTLVAHGRFSESTPNTYGTNVSGGIANLLRAAVCYRVGDQMDRCQNRCRQGILIAEDMIDRVFDMDPPEYPYDRARRGVWYEYLGDFRCIGTFDDPEPAYEQAIDVYAAAGDPGTECSEQEHTYSMAVYREVAKAIGKDPGPIDDIYNELTLTDWVEQKRTTYPSLLTEITDSGRF